MKALVQEVRDSGLFVETEKPLSVLYKGAEIGLSFADIVVDGAVICEVKAVRALLPEHQAQLINYLKATGLRVGLLINFAARVEYKRMVL